LSRCSLAVESGQLCWAVACSGNFIIRWCAVLLIGQ